MIALGLFAFDNQDPAAWYQTNPKQLVSAQNAKETLVPIHNQFVLWFKWMFINVFVLEATFWIWFIIIVILEDICKIRSYRILLVHTLLCLTSLNLICSMLPCFIAGAVWRFGEAGAYASKEPDAWGVSEHDDELLQTSSGKFMLIFYAIIFSSMSIPVLAMLYKCLTERE